MMLDRAVREMNLQEEDHVWEALKLCFAWEMPRLRREAPVAALAAVAQSCSGNADARLVTVLPGIFTQRSQ